MKVKLYLINIYEAISAHEKGVTAMRHLPVENAYFKYELLEEAEVELPVGFTLRKTRDFQDEEIFYESECFESEYSEMVTDYNGEKFVTELVTSDGVVELHTWEYDFG